MRTIVAPADTELLSQLRDGSEGAFELIYKKYGALLYIHARKLLRDDDEAKDVVQEVFSALWQKGSALNINTSLSSYLYAAVRNRIFNLIHHQKIKSDYVLSLQSFLKDGECFTDDLVREKELTAIIEEEIALLPDKMREVFEMSRRDQLSHKEIAELLNISDKTVKKQINNALKILRSRVNVSAGLLMVLLLR